MNQKGRLDSLSNFSKYISNIDINNKIVTISEDINKNYIDNSIFIGVLDGSVRFMMDLVANFKFPYEIGFIKVQSYKNMQRGNINLLLDIDKKNIKNKNVYIIEDIVDSGETIKFLKNHFLKMSPKSIKTVSLLVKKNSVSLCDFYGFIIKNKFVVGYGMDIDNLFRDLNDIYILDEENEK